MRLRDLPTNAADLARAERMRASVIARTGFTSTDRIRIGPRYLIDQGRFGKQTAIFKMCIFTKSRHRETFEKFSREVLFLNFLQHSLRHRRLAAAVPAVYDSGLGTRPWYIREYVTGTPQNVRGGNVRVQPSFYTEANRAWLLSVLRDLQSIKERELPRAFQPFLYRPFTIAKIRGFMDPHARRIDRTLNQRGAYQNIVRALRRRSRTYDHAPRVFGHQELYGPHILIDGSRRRLIDWENIGWSVPTSDPATVWLRAHDRPAWQRAFHRSFARTWSTYPRFEELWTTTVFVHAVFSVINLRFASNRADFIALERVSERIVRAVLAGKRIVNNE